MSNRSEKSRSRFERQQRQLLKSLWPDLQTERLWSKDRKGYTGIPRGMPYVLRLMDALSSGQPVSAVYLDLWCRSFDECFVVLDKPTEMSFSAGFTGSRAVNTWHKRLHRLSELDFIDCKPRSHGDFTYALICNPYLVIQLHHQNETPGFHHGYYNALLERANAIGAKDFLKKD